MSKLAFQFARFIARKNPHLSSVSSLSHAFAKEDLPEGLRKKDVVAYFPAVLNLAKVVRPYFPIDKRLKDHLLKKGHNAIVSRSLSVPAGFPEFKPVIIDRKKECWLINYSGYYKYSSRFGSWWQSGNYLIGREDGQTWAVRVPSTVKTVAEAQQWLMPKDVKDAQAKGKTVYRQGDIYFIKKRIKEDDFSALTDTRHTVVDKDGVLTVEHPEHPTLKLESSDKGFWRAYQQQQLDGNSRRGGD